jgi:hypothetical protein
LAKLSGSSISKPRKPHAFDLWAADNQDVFGPTMQAAIETQKPTCFQLAGLQTNVKKTEFEKLPKETKAEWWQKVKKTYDDAMQKWKTRMTTGPLTTPEDRQW